MTQNVASQKVTSGSGHTLLLAKWTNNLMGFGADGKVSRWWWWGQSAGADNHFWTVSKRGWGWKKYRINLDVDEIIEIIYLN